MKKIALLLAVAILPMLSTSCLDEKLDVENPSEYEANVIFASYTYSENVVNSIYQRFGMNKSYRNRFVNYWGTNTDCEWWNGAKLGDVKSAISMYNSATADGNQLNESDGAYSQMYIAIETANQCITGLRQYGQVDTRPEMAYLLGEALTLRAMLYYDLVKAWGDVPARFEPLKTETIYVQKSDRDEIFKQLIADLQEAAGYVYWPTEATQTMTTGRVNKAFVKGLLARVCLMAAGYGQRPDEGALGTGNIGSNRRSSRVEAGGEWADNYLYRIALQACKDVIEKENVYCKLSDDFEKIWIDMMQYKNITAGGETLFVIPFSHEVLRGQWNYTYAIKHPAKDSYVGKSGMGGSMGPVPTMYYEYGRNDERRDVSCVNYIWKEQAKPELEPAGINTWYFGKYRYEWMTNGSKVTANDDGIMPIVMRYADILLMAAECANELDDLNYAREQLRKVRLRAYDSHKTEANTYVDAIGSKDAMFRAIVDERALEFCGEAIRKADLIRWGMLGESIEETKDKMRALRSLTDYTSPTGREYKFSTINTSLWYRVSPTELVPEHIEMYGLDFGQGGNPEGEGWIQWYEEVTEDNVKVKKYEYIKESKIKDEKISYLSLAGSASATDQRMFWPLYSAITSTNPYLTNDYGY